MSEQGPLVLIVEDEAPLRRFLRAALVAQGYRLVEAETASEGLQRATEHNPDIVLLDLGLPGIDGIGTLEALRGWTKVPVIVLTVRDDEASKIAALDAGADDYITKPFSPKELVARVRAVLRRRMPHLAGEVVEIGTLSLNPATHRVMAGGQPVELGPTEFRLLLFFMSHTERVYSRAQLLDEVWGDHVFIEERTVDVHIRRLRAALEPTGEDSRIETVRGAGYRFRA